MSKLLFLRHPPVIITGFLLVFLLALAPAGFRHYLERGKFYDETGQHDLAIADYDRGLQLNPGYRNGRPYFEKACVLAKAGRTREALEAYRLYLRKAPPGSSDIDQARQRIAALEAS